MRSYSRFYRSIGQKIAGNRVDRLVVVLVVMMVMVLVVMPPMPMVTMLVIVGTCRYPISSQHV